jgi:hypothetical protein
MTRNPSPDGLKMPAYRGRGMEERSKVDRVQIGRVVRRKLSYRYDATISVETLERVSAHELEISRAQSDVTVLTLFHGSHQA